MPRGIGKWQYAFAAAQCVLARKELSGHAACASNYRLLSAEDLATRRGEPDFGYLSVFERRVEISGRARVSPLALLPPPPPPPPPRPTIAAARRTRSPWPRALFALIYQDLGQGLLQGLFGNENDPLKRNSRQVAPKAVSTYDTWRTKRACGNDWRLLWALNTSCSPHAAFGSTSLHAFTYTPFTNRAYIVATVYKRPYAAIIINGHPLLFARLILGLLLPYHLVIVSDFYSYRSALSVV
ncbi:hypothetical protein PENSPDRAFT_671928 [Peniophora sp. CONT]|nr:hypothetical protein PENSPDRAFT_671928 [Peniophora sp. CONT]